ncbi:MAG: hypothetical protein KF861_00735 [Planctomycetaceae bacterium]|nr:hypothetical protein [Planctomycetaceae bacterium]
MGRRLEELERPKAEERKRAAQFGSEDGEGNFPSPGKGKTSDIVGDALGVSGKTYEKAKAIAETAIDPLKAMVDTEQSGVLEVNPGGRSGGRKRISARHIPGSGR